MPTPFPRNAASDADTLTLPEFLSAYEHSVLTVDDGSGYWCCWDDKNGRFIELAQVDFANINDRPAECTHVSWYNK